MNHVLFLIWETFWKYIIYETIYMAHTSLMSKQGSVSKFKYLAVELYYVWIISDKRRPILDHKAWVVTSPNVRRTINNQYTRTI